MFTRSTPHVYQDGKRNPFRRENSMHTMMHGKRQLTYVRHFDVSEMQFSGTKRRHKTVYYVK